MSTGPRSDIPGDAVRQLRLARQQSTKQAADAIGVSVRTWERWERGDYAPDPRALRDYEATPVPGVTVTR